MSLDQAVLDKLAEPLDPNRVRKREGSGGNQLSYIEGYDAIRTANEVFGLGEWSYAVHDLVCLGEEPITSRQNKPGFRVAYRAVVTATAGGQSFRDVGYGDGVDYSGSRLTSHELAAKEAVTDGVKRCLKNFGDQFGLCLYDKEAPEHNATRSVEGAGVVVDGARSAQATSPAFSSGEFRFTSGMHKGKTLSEVPSSYLDWYAENGPKQDVKELISVYRGVTAEPALVGGGDLDDIPFAPSIDGIS